MARFTHFSKHAMIRISQRTKLTYFDIADILDFGLAINVGEEPVLDRKHWLFYSSADSEYFIAIQDSITGLIITVLPKHYHEKICWRIEKKQLSQARELVSKERVPKNNNNPRPSVIYLKVRYIGEKGYCKTKAVKKLKASDFKSNIENVVSHSSLESIIKLACEEKNIPIKAVVEVIVTLGSDGEPVIIDWEFIQDA